MTSDLSVNGTSSNATVAYITNIVGTIDGDLCVDDLQSVPDHPLARKLYAIVGGRIRKRRNELGLTQFDVAQRAGATRPTLSNLERGRQHVPLHLLHAVAKALGWEVHQLLPTQVELESDGGELMEVGGVVKTVASETVKFVESMLARAAKEAR